MSRTSRVSRPPGSRYVAIFVSDVERFGLAGAAILGHLEFLDRAQLTAGRPLASRARIIADLQGIVGKNNIDVALKDLVEIGVVTRHVESEMGKINIKRYVTYGIDAVAIARQLATTEIGKSGNSRNREPRQVLGSEPEQEPFQGVAYNVYIEEEKEEAAPCALAHGSASAAAAPKCNEGKRRVKRKSGIVTWWLEDQQDAAALEKRHNADIIRAAVDAVITAGKQPVPGLVAQQIEESERKQDITARIAKEDAKFRELAKLDPSAQAKGAAIVARVRRNLSGSRRRVTISG